MAAITGTHAPRPGWRVALRSVKEIMPMTGHMCGETHQRYGDGNTLAEPWLVLPTDVPS